MNYRRIGRWAAAAAGIAVAGAGLWWLRERATERPEHETLLADGDFEIRRYPALVTAETVQIGTRDRALGNGFGLLADYIFASGREREPIAMTVPVISEAVGASEWRTRFVMPKACPAETLPAPGAGITIGSLPARTIAVLNVGGKVDDRVLATKRGELLARIAAHGRQAGTVQYAFYNSPFIPGPLRHNEVWAELLE